MQRWQSSILFRIGCLVIGTVSLFSIYVFGIWENPPGFYLDESALSYNAYLVSQTGAGESGVKFPLYFPVYTGGFTQYSNPTQIYLLAILFKIFGPGILTARLFAAACVFAACILLGFLARRISGKNSIGIIVGGAALLTPWLFEVGRLVLETFFYPLAVVLLLWSVYRVSKKDAWSFFDAAAIALSLTLLTYSYTIGRMLGPLLAGGLLVFATSWKRVIAILKVWVMFGLALVPMLVYIVQNPELTTRFRLLSYIKPESTYSDIAVNFVSRFFEDINPVTMVVTGDINPRHHIDSTFGSFYLSVLILTVAGILLVLFRYRRSSWWWYVVFGLAASAVPGALTIDSFHTLRMIAYPIFLLILTVPALEWLLKSDKHDREETAEQETKEPTGKRNLGYIMREGLSMVLLALFVFEASYFHAKYYKEGPKREEVFDVAYKPLYDIAVARPERPIYLVDGYWGPAYIHAFWYATLEGRDTSEFVHQQYGVPPPAGVFVLSSEQNCTGCQLIRRESNYLLYLKNPEKPKPSIQAR